MRLLRKVRLPPMGDVGRNRLGAEERPPWERLACEPLIPHGGDGLRPGTGRTQSRGERTETERALSVR